MSAIVNSNNIIFANGGGGSGNPVYYVHTASIELEKVKEVIENSGVVIPYYTVMGGSYFFNIDTQAAAGTKRGYTFVNDGISSPAGHWLHLGGCRQWRACGQSAWQNTLLAP